MDDTTTLTPPDLARLDRLGPGRLEGYLKNIENELPRLERALAAVLAFEAELAAWETHAEKNLKEIYESSITPYLPTMWPAMATLWATREAVRVIRPALREAHRVGTEIIDFLRTAARELTIPLKAYRDVDRWEMVRHHATNVNGAIQKRAIDPNLVYQGRATTRFWSGLAADAYLSQLEPQQNATRRVAEIASLAGAAVNIYAAAATTFAGAAAVLAYRATVILTSFAVYRSVKDLTRDLAVLAGMYGALRAAYEMLSNVMRAQSARLRLLTSERAAFEPGNHWPDPTGDVQWPRKATKPDGSIVMESSLPQ